MSISMKTSKILISSILLLHLIGCSRQFHVAKLIPGRSSIDDAIDRLGEPTEASIDNPSYQKLLWRDITVQAREDIITVVQRKPASYEEKLQFWRQHYKGSPQSFSKVENTAQAGEHLWQLNLPNEHINIIYDESRDLVTKVMYYDVR